MTLFISAIDVAHQRLTWVRAGHDPAILYDGLSDTFTELGGHGLPLGVFGDSAYHLSGCAFHAGQLFLIGTDGIWEAGDENGQMFGKRRIKEIMRRHHNDSARVIVDKVIAALHHFRGTHPIEDDITLVVVKRLD
jgi:sigma-B regulation protein RsbU (phosphoserine phosphatase)